jgi:hypothetical protein
MTSWIHVFSKFTSEALLFESLVICVLIAGYALFWVVHKRRVGVIDSEVPATVVRGYLNVLIADAETLRKQLFGLLANSGLDAAEIARFSAAANFGMASALVPGGVSPSVIPGAVVDPSIEAKLAEQAKAVETLLAEKSKIERELAEARAAGGGKQAPSTGGDSAELAKLNEKIRALEARLAEYSVIEDDLANLKRLQQENAQLKATLAGQGLSVPAPTAVAAVAAVEPTIDAVAEPVTEAFAEPVAVAEAVPEAAFEGLVDQVEQSLQPAEAVAAAEEAPATEAPAEAPAPAAVEAASSDADLVAEFEKMLNS